MSDKRHLQLFATFPIADSLIAFLRQRFSTDEVITSQLVVFVRFDVDKTDLRAVHVLGADLDIAELTLEFEELARSNNQLIRRPLLELVKCLSTVADYHWRQGGGRLRPPILE